MKPLLVLICWVVLLYGLMVSEEHLALAQLQPAWLLSDMLLILALSLISDFQDQQEDRLSQLKTCMTQLSLHQAKVLVLFLLCLRLPLAIDLMAFLIAIATLLQTIFFFKISNTFQTHCWFMDGLLLFESALFILLGQGLLFRWPEY